MDMTIDAASLSLNDVVMHDGRERTVDDVARPLPGLVSVLFKDDPVAVVFNIHDPVEFVREGDFFDL